MKLVYRLFFLMLFVYFWGCSQGRTKIERGIASCKAVKIHEILKSGTESLSCAQKFNSINGPADYAKLEIDGISSDSIKLNYKIIDGYRRFKTGEADARVIENKRGLTVEAIIDSTKKLQIEIEGSKISNSENNSMCIHSIKARIFGLKGPEDTITPNLNYYSDDNYREDNTPYVFENNACDLYSKGE